MAKKQVKLSNSSAGIPSGRGEVPSWVCPKCKKRKPFEDFGFRQIKPDIHIKQSWCKECR